MKQFKRTTFAAAAIIAALFIAACDNPATQTVVHAQRIPGAGPGDAVRWVQIGGEGSYFHYFLVAEDGSVRQPDHSGYYKADVIHPDNLIVADEDGKLTVSSIASNLGGHVAALRKITTEGDSLTYVVIGDTDTEIQAEPNQVYFGDLDVGIAYTVDASDTYFSQNESVCEEGDVLTFLEVTPTGNLIQTYAVITVAEQVPAEGGKTYLTANMDAADWNNLKLGTAVKSTTTELDLSVYAAEEDEVVRLAKIIDKHTLAPPIYKIVGAENKVTVEANADYILLDNVGASGGTTPVYGTIAGNSSGSVTIATSNTDKIGVMLEEVVDGATNLPATYYVTSATTVTAEAGKKYVATKLGAVKTSNTTTGYITLEISGPAVSANSLMKLEKIENGVKTTTYAPAATTTVLAPEKGKDYLVTNLNNTTWYPININY